MQILILKGENEQNNRPVYTIYLVSIYFPFLFDNQSPFVLYKFSLVISITLSETADHFPFEA